MQIIILTLKQKRSKQKENELGIFSSFFQKTTTTTTTTFIYTTQKETK